MRASTDVVSSGILPGVDVDTDEGRAKLIEVIKQLVSILEHLTTVCERAIAGHLRSVGATLTEQ